MEVGWAAASTHRQAPVFGLVFRNGIPSSWPPCRQHRRGLASGEPLSNELLLDVSDRQLDDRPKACKLVHSLRQPQRLNPLVLSCTEPTSERTYLAIASPLERQFRQKRPLPALV